MMIPRDDRQVPLMASWNYGKGKAVAFTTDLSGRWSREWIHWIALERFWGKIFDWLRPTKESLPPHEVRINLLKNQPVLELYLSEEKTDGSLFPVFFQQQRRQKGRHVAKVGTWPLPNHSADFYPGRLSHRTY